MKTMWYNWKLQHIQLNEPWLEIVTSSGQEWTDKLNQLWNLHIHSYIWFRIAASYVGTFIPPIEWVGPWHVGTSSSWQPCKWLKCLHTGEYSCTVLYTRYIVLTMQATCSTCKQHIHLHLAVRKLKRKSGPSASLTTWSHLCKASHVPSAVQDTGIYVSNCLMIKLYYRCI